MPAPVLTGISSNQMYIGDAPVSVVLSGSNFDPGTAYTVEFQCAVVGFQGMASGVTVISSTEMVCTVPMWTMGAMISGTCDVRVTDDQAQSDTLAAAFSYNFHSAPTLDFVSPASMYLGDPEVAVTISGTNFRSGVAYDIRFEDSSIMFSGMATGVTFISSTTLVCTVPMWSMGLLTQGNCGVSIRDEHNQSANLPTAFQYLFHPAPTVTGVTPGSMCIGDTEVSVTISGTNFRSGVAYNVRFVDAAQSFDGTGTSVSVIDGSRISCTVPMWTLGLTTQGNCNVIVTDEHNQSGERANAFRYKFHMPPEIGGVVPDSMFLGDIEPTVTIAGDNFRGGAMYDIRFSDAAHNFEGIPTGITVVNAASIICTAPMWTMGLLTEGHCQVSIRDEHQQQDALADAFDYLFHPAPAITGVSQGSMFIGDTPPAVTITGANFRNGVTYTIRFVDAAIGFDGIATSVTFINSTTLNCIVPMWSFGPLVQGTCKVMVTDEHNQTCEKADAFRYLFHPAPINLAVSPNTSPVQGGGAALLTGENFRASAAYTLQFGGFSTGVSYVNSTTLYCTIPTGAVPGGVAVVLMDEHGQTASAQFTYT